MILRFLRWFPRFCALEAQLAESASARILAEDRVREYRTKCESAESERDKAQAECGYLLKAVADWQAISAGHLPIFNVVPVPPMNDEDPVLRSPLRRNARDVQHERNAQARRSAMAPVEVDHN